MGLMNTSLKSWTRLVEFLALITAPFVLLVGLVLYVDYGTSTSSAATTPAAAPVAHAAARTIPTFSMTVVTDDQTGKDGDIAYIPSDLTLPAHSTVRIRITNFDDATAQKPARYARVWGTVGNTIQVRRMMAVSMPNMLSAARTVRALPAATEVSHTFTSTGLHLNVPVFPAGVTTFVIRTGAPGHYTWQCMDPCGSGKTGWGGAMVMKGYMSGTITVA
jgi:heme/copper-type cytochrome/quinol oxidase subunit 2